MMEETNRPKTRVQWLLGNNCNYSCSYCHEMFRVGNKPFPNDDLLREVCQDIIYHFDNRGRDVAFEFIGGEPTLASSMKDIGRKLHNHPVDIVLKTNGSASIEWWTETKRYLSDVIISVHREFCDLNHIEQVISLLKQDSSIHPVNVQILIPTNHNDSNWNWAIETRQRFQRKFGLGEIQLLWLDFARGSSMYYPYKDYQWKQYIEFTGNDPRSPNPEHEGKRKQHSFRGHNCYAGIDLLTIDSDGRIWRGWCQQGGPIGSIYELPIVWPTDPIVCQKEICSNGFDQLARKELISS
jgi:pyruvate-formate lyase-activating enzyme